MKFGLVSFFLTTVTGVVGYHIYSSQLAPEVCDLLEPQPGQPGRRDCLPVAS